MNKIKFSHNYKKLNGETNAELFNVIVIDLENQAESFIDYDTDNYYYDLPKKGKYILLLFKGFNGTIFTTLRRHTDSKFDYYYNLIGQPFNIKIIERS